MEPNTLLAWPNFIMQKVGVIVCNLHSGRKGSTNFCTKQHIDYQCSQHHPHHTSVTIMKVPLLHLDTTIKPSLI
jgi:hypothetical protein